MLVRRYEIKFLHVTLTISRITGIKLVHEARITSIALVICQCWQTLPNYKNHETYIEIVTFYAASVDEL